MAESVPTYHFHVSREARERYSFPEDLFSTTGNVIQLDLHAARVLVARMNEARRAAGVPADRALRAGDLNALGLIDEVLHYIVGLYRRRVDPLVMGRALAWVQQKHGAEETDGALLAFLSDFPPPLVAAGVVDAQGWLAQSAGGVPGRQVVLEEMLLLALANADPAFVPFDELFDDETLSVTPYASVVDSVAEFFRSEPVFGPDEEDLITMLRAPVRAAPDSLAGQLEFIRTRWGSLLEDLLLRLLIGLDLLREEEKLRFGPFVPGPPEVYEYGADAGEREAFSTDTEWMPRVVMMAKNALVWLDQLSRAYGREIRRLDQVPDEELDRLAGWGFTALWLIGVWERSGASREIKRRMGNPEAEASAYSLYDYVVAAELGGEQSLANLRERAWRRGIRLASDMVPNHTGVDSAWMRDHPERFLAWPHPWPPFPGYSFGGPDVSTTPGIGIHLEDHYWDRTDAAVVFRRVDQATGASRLIYHGNDGTHMPWNDTAQLDFLRPDTREAVVGTILHVARMFPIIRFDAAMTLAKKHYQRLWYPEPGRGGDIPSRAGNGLSRHDFDRAMPVEFWREVVDRIAREAPDTLLLAEAFWMLEGFFVRTLGMHRVYNSAFMHMLMKEDNAGYRQTIRNTLEFDPEVLKRFVNFMSNPDEQTAIEQFGDGDKYLGVCTLMATLPGLPMFAHGQVQGFREKYGMEYRRAYRGEQADPDLVSRHERYVFPLLRRRWLFSGVDGFLLYDFFGADGRVNEDVFAFSNRRGSEAGLVLYNNRYAEAKGWIRTSAAFAVKSGSGKSLVQQSLADGLGLPAGSADFVVFREHSSGLQFIRSCSGLRDQGMYVELGAYQRQIFLDFSFVQDDAQRRWSRLAAELGGRGVPGIDDAMRDMILRPARESFSAFLAAGPDAPRRRAEFIRQAAALGMGGIVEGTAAAQTGVGPTVAPATAQAGAFVPATAQAGAFIRILRLLRPLRGPAGEPRILSWIDELRLAPALAEALMHDGWDARTAAAADALVSLALRHETPIAWSDLLADEAAERFLQVNTFEGVRWFGKESLDALIACVSAAWHDLGLEAPEEKTVLEAARATGYRWDVFRGLEALKAAPEAPKPRTAPPGRRKRDD
jgi:glycosidase